MKSKNLYATSSVLMVRPANFYLNPQTAINNAFQSQMEIDNINERALEEFDAFVDLLKSNGINVIVHQDTAEPSTPDSIFPNNWISMHRDNSVLLYPMFAENRRDERNKGVLELVKKNFVVTNITDFTQEELVGRIVEGTGSLIFDHEFKLAYACKSERTDEMLAKEITEHLGYRLIYFDAFDSNGSPIYHTNVIMCVAQSDVIICLDSIPENQRDMVIQEIHNSKKNCIELSFGQMNRFAGNMLQLISQQGEAILVMSASAYNSLTHNQINSLEKNYRLIYSDLTTIETAGGGSARCMLAEIYNSKIV